MAEPDDRRTGGREDVRAGDRVHWTVHGAQLPLL